MWLLACTPGEGEIADPGGQATDPGVAPFGIEVQVSEAVRTVLVARWSTERPTSGRVEFGPTDAYGAQTHEVAVGTEHEVPILGMPADTEVHLRVVSTDGSETAVSADLTATTGSLPAGLLDFTVTGDPDSWCCYQVVPILGEQTAVLVVDTWGRIVWYAFEERGFGMVRGALSRDRSMVLYNAEGGQTRDGAEGEIVRIAMDGTVMAPVPWPYLEHDFVELPDGTLAAITGVEVPGEPTRPHGDAVVEVAPDGTRTERFNGLDWWFGDDGTPAYTHVNALDYSETDDAYLLSEYLMGSIAAVDRTTGTPLWAVSGGLNEFEFTDGTSGFVHSHQMARTEGGLLIFDNGHDDAPESRVVELALDTGAMEAHEAWSFTREPALYSFVLGDVHLLEGDVVRVTWSIAGEIQHLARDGSVLWQLDSALGTGLGYGEVVQSLYR